LEVFVLGFGGFELQPERRRLLQDGEPVPIGARAFDVLLALVDRHERVVSKIELLDLVWPGLVVEENNLQVQISTLRKLLGPRAIATIPGRGYRFTLPLDDASRVVGAASAQPVAPGPAQSLKQVTILFLNVVGSTTSSQDAELEDVQARIDDALARCIRIVEEHRGKVFRYVGDSLLAAFGTDQTEEDDAERAVQTGLALLAEARPQGDAADRHLDPDGLNVCVGIHTGRILLGDGDRAERSVRGLAVNIAMRMEQSAPRGGLLISHDTYRHVRGMFDVTAAPPVAVNGMSATIRAYLVERAKKRSFQSTNRGIDGLETRMIGRAAEFARLTSAYEALLADGQLVVVSLVGEAGLGKSRLLLEFDHWLELRPEEVWLFHGRARPRGRNTPYGLLRELLAWRFEILDSDSQPSAQAKLARGFAALFGERAEEQTSLIGALIGLDYRESPHILGIAQDARQIRDRAFHAVAQYFRLLHQSTGAPIALLLDDLHWADEGSLDLINHLQRTACDLPMLALCSTRPTLFERRPLWGSGQSNHERIDLRPLSKRSSQELADALLSRLDPVPAELRDLLTGSAEGNPFFIEELLGMLIDDGVILTHTPDDPERWRMVPDKLFGVRVPPKLNGLLQARLDGLPPTERAALQEASAIGHVFWDEALRHINPDAPGALDGLTRRELVLERETSTFEGVREYVFRHHLLHQVTYDGAPKRNRQAQHRLAAAWLATRLGERGSTYDGMIAEHYERGGDATNAAIYLRRAGEDAAKSYGNDAALDYIGRALVLVPEEEAETRFALIRAQAYVLGRTGNRVEQARAIASLESCADKLNDDTRRAQVLGMRAQHEAETGDPTAACVSAALAVELADRAGTPEAALGALIEWTNVLQRRVDRSEAFSMAERCLALSRIAGQRSAEGIALNQLAVASAGDGKYSLSRTYAEQALQITRDLGDRSVECVVLYVLGDIEQKVGNSGIAMERLRTGLQTARDIGWRVMECHLLCAMSSTTRALLGDSGEALSLARRASAIELQSGDRHAVAQAFVAEGHAYVSLGDASSAIPRYVDALQILRQLDSLSAQPGALTGLAQAEMNLDRPEVAMEHLSEVLQFIDRGEQDEAIDDLLWVYSSCHQMLRARTDPRAGDILRRAHDRLNQQSRSLSESDRESFLRHVPANREIQEAWSRI
jgi:class 3 adenylate cyclase/tetratricopeptide (TPR) repeat protein